MCEVRVWKQRLRRVALPEHASTEGGASGHTRRRRRWNLARSIESGRFEQSNVGHGHGTARRSRWRWRTGGRAPTPTPTPTWQHRTRCTDTNAHARARSRHLLRGAGHGEQAPRLAGGQVVAAMQRVVELGDNHVRPHAHRRPSRSTSRTRLNGVLLAVQRCLRLASRAELPDECSFQRGEHVFFAPLVQDQRRSRFAKEWFERAVGTPDVSPRWISHATFDHFVSDYTVEGRAPSLSQDRFQRVLFYEQADDVRQGPGQRGHDDGW